MQSDLSQTTPHISKSSQIYGIDFLRFFAASLVMVYHLAFISWASPNNFLHTDIGIFDPFKPLAPFIGTGWIGVQIFFVISGFVIAYTGNGASPLKFLNRRIARLGPAVWICATLTVPILLLDGIGGKGLAVRYLGSMLFLPYVGKVASSYWTLPVEVFFYSIILALLCCNRFRQIERATLILGYVSTLIWSVYWLRFFFPLGVIGRLAGMLGDRAFTQVFLAQHGAFFALGLMIWLIRTCGWTRSRVIGFSAFTAAGLLEIIAETAKSSAWTGFYENSSVPVMIWVTSLIVIAVSIIYNESIGRLIGSGHRTVRFIGLMTYPLYLIHEPFGGFILVHLLRDGFPAFLSLTIACGAPIILAGLITSQLEPALQNTTRKMLATLEARLPAVFDRYRAPTAVISVGYP